MKKQVRIKRIYDPFSKDDGARIFVDRFWARGLTKEKAHIDEWLKDIAPSDALRKWYSHDPDKWKYFKDKYFHELDKKKNICEKILEREEIVITLLFSTKELNFNNAAALKEYLEMLQR